MSYEEESVEILSDYELERDKPMPSKHHAFIQTNIIIGISIKYPDKFQLLSEVKIGFPVRDRIPDLAVYPPMEFGEEEIKMTEIPLCVIEILSLSRNHLDLTEKRKEYFAASIQSYWLILPDLKSVYVYYSLEDFEIYSYRDVLIDKKLDIELDLNLIFK